MQPRRHEDTNTGVEYWGGGRVAALIHTALDGSKDLALPDNERAYLLAGSQHGPARFPSSVTTGQQKDNPNNYWWTMRALLVAMDKCVVAMARHLNLPEFTKDLGTSYRSVQGTLVHILWAE
jgi:hypothetical protein